MIPAEWVVVIGTVIGAAGWLGMVKHRTKAYGYLLYSLSVFALGTVVMVDAPTIGSICIGGVCYLFALLTVFAAALGQRKERESIAQQSVDQGQVDGSHAEEDRHGAHQRHLPHGVWCLHLQRRRPAHRPPGALQGCEEVVPVSPEQKGGTAAVVTMNVIIWSAAISLFITGKVPPLWTLPVTLVMAAGVGLAVGLWVVRHERKA